MKSACHEFLTPIQVEYDIDLSDHLSSDVKDHCSEIEFSADPMDVVKVIFLGAQGVGKTSIIQQFVWNHFNEEYAPTEATQHVYYSSVIFNQQMYQLKITDAPPISHFPADSYVEWMDFRCYGLRNANAYIFVFDLSDLDSFQYIRMIRDQIAESRDLKNVPILVIGNKQDLISNLRRTHFSYLSSNTHAANKRAEMQKEKLKEIVSLIRKQWKCSYVDCSAKFNWKVVAVFKEIIRVVDGGEQPRAATLGHRQVTSLVIENTRGISGGDRRHRRRRRGRRRVPTTKCIVS